MCRFYVDILLFFYFKKEFLEQQNFGSQQELLLI